MTLFALFNIGWRRWRTHGLMLICTVIACVIIHFYSPFADLNYMLTLGCGYISLILIVVSLLIGPFKLFQQRRNPVNLNFRRDVGIWAGLTGCIHVICVLIIRVRGSIIYLFLKPKPRGVGYDLLTTPQGISNNIGLIATLILIMLLALSNDYTLKYFKGKRWKLLQRFNYGLVVLAFIHTILYQRLGSREQVFVLITLSLAVAGLAFQTIGFILMRNRRAKTLSQLQ